MCGPSAARVLRSYILSSEELLRLLLSASLWASAETVPPLFPPQTAAAAAAAAVAQSLSASPQSLRTNLRVVSRSSPPLLYQPLLSPGPKPLFAHPVMSLSLNELQVYAANVANELDR